MKQLTTTPRKWLRLRLSAGIAFLSLCILGIIPVTQAQDQPIPCEPDPQKTFSTWQAQDEQCKQHQDINLSIDLSYPQELTVYPNALKVINDYLEQQKSDFLNTSLQFAGDFIPTESYPWTLEISYDEEKFSDSVVTVLFYLWTYTGGAHGSHVTTTFTFDLASDTQLALPDLFVDGTDVYGLLAPMAQTDLTEQIKKLLDDPNATDVTWVEDGAAPVAENYQSFALTSDALVLIFQEYQVAPYVVGPLQVSIPLSDLQDALKPEFQPAK
ncbi:MAG TPA: DUF3298 and DUF4163 domain-containing protein [Phototrophicaceae bacterium]|jgi:hypothetical protein|nr:DUF3298 and DUF4163 domain-containing protein [Phototrophicaceae bacterium]